MCAAAKNDSAQRRHIPEVPSPGNGDVFGPDSSVVRRVKLDPAERRTEYGYPRVRGAPSKWRRTLLTTIGPRCSAAHVSTYVACGKPARAQTRDHEVSEILAHPAPVAEHLAERGRDGRCAGRVLELTVQLRHQAFRTGEN